HRGACGCDPLTGDGAGILVQIPHAFFKKALAAERHRLPEPGEYGVGVVFLPRETNQRNECQEIFESAIREEGLKLICWRSVPIAPAEAGPQARAVMPEIRQIFIGRGRKVKDQATLDRKLYVVRKLVENRINAAAGIPDSESFHIPSLSTRTIVYKGLLISWQIPRFYHDLRDPGFASALALIHQRFSTNTLPSWDRAHPYRFIAHNGEINTLRGNENWMHAREKLFSSPLFGDDVEKLVPVINPRGSDSAKFDNALELLLMTGRSIDHSVMMMIPEAWQNHESMSDAKRAFYQYHSSLMEPWDGPASIAFTDGVRIGAVLDRNGLRPSRYVVTKDGLVVMASEVGVLDIPPDRVESKGRLQPGRMFLVDTSLGRIVGDEEIKEGRASRRPYRQWLDATLVPLATLPDAASLPEPFDRQALLEQQQAFGYTTEELRMLLAPMAINGQEAVGSMGTDTPPAVLSDRPQILFQYFKQLFAQVTNPAIDPLREELVMSLTTTIGSEQNLFDETELHCRQLELKSPVLTNEELERIKELDQEGLHATTLSTLFHAEGGEAALEKALDDLRQNAAEAVAAGATILVLSDRGVDEDHAPIPSLLAVSAVHHHLIRVGSRTKCGIVVESGEPREVHHFALLAGYGAGAFNPYLAYETVADMVEEGVVKGVSADEAVEHYVKAVNKGLLKVMSKMGISTLQSYRGAQIFEAIGLARELVDRYFTWTPSQIEGIGLDAIAREVKARHDHAYRTAPSLNGELDPGGQYQYRRRGEYHMYNPETIAKLQHSARSGNYKVFKQYSALV
ncbi:MAG: glutamate synthase central domain-containing protein, partial [Candidatus Binatia bacterium]